MSILYYKILLLYVLSTEKNIFAFLFQELNPISDFYQDGIFLQPMHAVLRIKLIKEIRP